MTIEEAKENYPRFFEKVPSDLLSIRELIVVDYNYDDIDAEETADFEPTEYNHMIYITELSSKTLGEHQVNALVGKLNDRDEFVAFYAPEADLYGVQTDLDESEIEILIFNCIEEMLS